MTDRKGPTMTGLQDLMTTRITSPSPPLYNVLPDTNRLQEHLERSMRALSADMEWNLLHIEATVSPSQAHWEARPLWQKRYYRTIWWLRARWFGIRARLAGWIWPYCTCTHDGEDM